MCIWQSEKGWEVSCFCLDYNPKKWVLLWIFFASFLHFFTLNCFYHYFWMCVAHPKWLGEKVDSVNEHSWTKDNVNIMFQVKKFKSMRFSRWFIWLSSWKWALWWWWYRKERSDCSEEDEKKMKSVAHPLSW